MHGRVVMLSQTACPSAVTEQSRLRIFPRKPLYLREVEIADDLDRLLSRLGSDRSPFLDFTNNHVSDFEQGVKLACWTHR